MTGYRGVDRDITGRKLQEEVLRETERLDSIGILAAGVAQEINNPLTSVMLYSEQVLMEEVSEVVRNSVLTVNLQAQRMARIVKNPLDFARHSEPERRATDVVLMIRRALELKSYDFAINNVTLIEDGLPNKTDVIPQVMLDENQIVQVILNLLNNAEQ